MLKDRLIEFEKKASWLKEGVLYHRGKHGNGVKENTLEAFKKAIKDNLSVELDVRLTIDNLAVVAHDDNLKRMYGIDLKISELTYNEICKYTNNDIPLFSDVLELIDDKIGVMVEIKTGNKKIVDIVYNILKEYKGRYVVVSFDPFILKEFRKKDSTIIRGQLSYNYSDNNMNWLMKFLLRRLCFNFISKPHFISYGIDNCDYKLLREVRKKGYFIIGWTYKSEKNKEKLLELYDNMIIEDIDICEFKK